MRSRLPPLGLGLLQIGCQAPAPTSTWWQFPATKTEADFRADDNERALLARGAQSDPTEYNDLDLFLVFGLAERAGARRDLVRDYHGCLVARGYAQVPPPATTPEVAGKHGWPAYTPACWLAFLGGAVANR